jgi:polyisoprenoid-binding protein YceI
MFGETKLMTAPFRILPLATAAAIAWTTCAGAQDISEASGRYAITPKGTKIAFKVDSVGPQGIHGTFGDFRGEIKIDAKAIEKSSVTFTLSPASVDGGEPRVTGFLKSNAVFDAANWPEITFVSSRVTRSGERSAKVEGVVTARGKKKAVAFVAVLEDLQKNTARFKVAGRVPRSPFGMDVGTPIYSNLVDFDITVTANRR